MRVIGWLLLSLLLAACSMQQGALTGADKAPEFRKSSWQALPEWRHVQLSSSLDALRQGCVSLANRDEWQQVCAEAALLDAENSDGLHRFFESHFTPYQLRNGDGSAEGLITGYYEPLLYGSREKSERFRYPVFGVPDDLMIVDLSNLYPQLKGMRLRGRIEGRRIVPYYDRADIDAGHAPADKVLLWVDDDISLFFLQVQGSGRVDCRMVASSNSVMRIRTGIPMLRSARP